jgi:hypothetical protein
MVLPFFCEEDGSLAVVRLAPELSSNIRGDIFGLVRDELCICTSPFEELHVVGFLLRTGLCAPRDGRAVE